MTTRIGILSDTHLHECDAFFCQQANDLFRSCSIIIHAGDITDLCVLQCFKNKKVIAVHGNMCNRKTTLTLPESQEITVSNHSIAVCHGAGSRFNIEERLYERFHDADCIVYGHTHTPVIHTVGKTLYINPGSFLGTGPYGSRGTYAILEITADSMQATLHEIEQQL